MRPLAYFLMAFMFAGSLMPERDMQEMAKLPALLGHFIEHARQGEGVMDFLAEHYGAHDHEMDHSGESDHDGLPFRERHHDEQSCPSTMAGPAVQTTLIVDHAPLALHIGLPDDPPLPNDHGVSIWRPPKRA